MQTHAHTHTHTGWLKQIIFNSNHPGRLRAYCAVFIVFRCHRDASTDAVVLFFTATVMASLCISIFYRLLKGLYITTKIPLDTSIFMLLLRNSALDSGVCTSWFYSRTDNSHSLMPWFICTSRSHINTVQNI